MEPKRKLRLILLAFWVPWIVGISYVIATGRQQLPGWVVGCMLLYSGGVLLCATVFAKKHRGDLRDAEKIRKQQEWAKRHRHGIVNALLIGSTAAFLTALVLLLRGHLAPQNKIVSGYCIVVSVITLILCIRVKIRGYPDERQKQPDLDGSGKPQYR